MIPTPRLLAQVVDLLNLVPMHDRATKGDVYEYLLAKIATAGQKGQFRTPRHIIKMMVAMLAPQPSDLPIWNGLSRNRNHPFQQIYGHR